ncbi:MAG: hypothetical protein WCK35_18625 [Chloroflexota bacterium]
MPTQIIKVFIFKTKEYASSLSQAEQNAMLEKAANLRTQFGAQQIGNGFSYWSNEAWQYFGVEMYPSIEAVLGHSQKMMEIGWPRGIEAQTFLGTSDSPVTPVTEKSGFLKLWFAEFTADGYAGGEKGWEALVQKRNEFYPSFNVRDHVYGKLFSAEQFTTFGLEWLPSIDDVIGCQNKLEGIQWSRYIRAKIYLGVPV